MAHPYGDATTLQALIGTTRETALIALAGSTPADVLAKHRGDADNIIDARLMQTYVVPFNAWNATPSSSTTPPLITTISDQLTAARLLKANRSTSKLAESWQQEAFEMLTALRGGDLEIDATKVAATAGRITIDFSAQEPIASGRSDGTTDMNTEPDEGTRSEW